jgi:very-short-patch-repair endonuclease
MSTVPRVFRRDRRVEHPSRAQLATRPAAAPERAVEPIDRAISKLATTQDGVVSHDQLLALGLSRRSIGHRLSTGRLHAEYRGVYAVGHERDLVRHDGLILTSPARTIADLAATRPRVEVERAWAEAQVLRLLRPSELAAAVRPGRRGAALLARLVGEPEPTRSELERAMMAALRAAGLPLPHVNVRVGPYLVDFLWSGPRVVVETDGWAAHGHRGAFERDRMRDATLQARGYAVLRFTWRQVRNEPVRVAVAIAQVLALRSHSPTAGRRAS